MEAILAFHDQWKAEIYKQASDVQAEGLRPEYNTRKWWAWVTRRVLENLDTMLLPRTPEVSPEPASSSEEEKSEARCDIDECANSDGSSPRPASQCDTDGEIDDGEIEEGLRDGPVQARRGHRSLRPEVQCGQLDGEVDAEEIANGRLLTEGTSAEAKYLQLFWNVAAECLPQTRRRAAHAVPRMREDVWRAGASWVIATDEIVASCR